MHHIIEYCHRQQDRFQSSAESIERQQEISDLDNLVRSLRFFRALFHLPGSWNIHWLPDDQKRDAMIELLEQARYVNDLHLQQRVMRENENLLGMDLSYLVQYAMESAAKEEHLLRELLKEFDHEFPPGYVGELEAQMRKTGEKLMYKELLDFTHKQLKKTFKILKHQDKESPTMHRVRTQLIDTINYLELLNQPGEAQEIRKCGIFLDIWHDRVNARELISRYQKDHPEGAANNAGTLEILEDYLKQKVQIV
jgi:hypothetical protein